jgi:ABC-type uncharacterized transport system involved in gliding motility auxiliary subunit
MTSGSGDQAKEERVKDYSEQGFTNGLTLLTRGEKKKIYFLTGHGERELKDDKGETGLGKLIEQLAGEGYTTETLTLAGGGDVPADAAMVVIAAPEKPLLMPDGSAPEIQALKKFLDAAGKALVLIEPNTDAGLGSLLAEYGIQANSDLVVDPNSRALNMGASIPLIMQYDPNHPITKGFRVMSAFPTARSLSVDKPADANISNTKIASTSPSAWGETDLKSEEAAFDEHSDHAGPVVVGVAAVKKADKPPSEMEEVEEAQKKAPEARLVVFGDADFCSNSALHFSGNLDLIMNSFAWLSEEQDLITIRPKQRKGSRIFLSQTQGNLLFYGFLIILPVGILVLGLSIWLDRRRR